MPALRLLGRPWRLATDDLPLPSLLAAAAAMMGTVLATLAYRTCAGLGEAGGASGARGGDRCRADLLLLWAHVLAVATGAALAAASARGAMGEDAKRRVWVPLCVVTHVVAITGACAFGVAAVTEAHTSLASPTTASAAIAAAQWVLAAAAALAVYDTDPDWVDETAAPHAAGVLWERRCVLVSRVFCCPGLMGDGRDDEHDAAVDEAGGDASTNRPLRRIARLLHTFLTTARVDLVASDYAAALLLVAAEQREPSAAVPPPAVDAAASLDASELARVEAASRFSLAAYGLPMHVWVHGAAEVSHANLARTCPTCCAPMLRLLRPRRMEEPPPPLPPPTDSGVGGWCADASGRCGRRRRVDSMESVAAPEEDGDLDSARSLPPAPPPSVASRAAGADMRETMERQAVLRLAGIPESDLLRLRLQRLVGSRPRGGAGLRELPYFVALNRPHRRVVVSVRGTLSLDDCATDCLCEPAPLPPPLTGSCHAGVLERASEVARSLRASGVLHALLLGDAGTPQAVPDCAGWDLVFTGHSLGGGVAAVLALLLRADFPAATCVLFGPPGGLFDDVAARQLPPDACTSVVLGWDWIPRLSVSNAQRLRSACISAHRRSRVRKLQLMVRTGARRGRVPRASEVLSPSAPAASEDDCLLADMEEGGGVLSGACDRFPGKCVYIPRSAALGADEAPLPRRGDVGRGLALARRYTAPRCVDAAGLRRDGLRVGPAMLADHMPDL